MSGMKVNKLCGAILLAGLVAMLTSFIAKQLVHLSEPEQVRYPLAEVQPVGDSARPKSPVIEPVAQLLATADLARGQNLSRRCASCHTFSPDQGNKLGPGLWGVVGRAQGQASGFNYSAALAALDGVWSYEELNRFLASPRRYARGTNMNFSGLRSVRDRAELIAWLRTLSLSPTPLPLEPAAQ